MSYEQIIMMIELAFTAIGLLFVIFGWIIPFRQNLILEARQRENANFFRQKQWEKEHIDKQISEFYGPISALLKKQDILFERILYMFGRSFVFRKDQTQLSQLSENEQKIWVHFVDTYIIPQNKRIVEIIQKNQHLIYKSEVPPCFEKYLDYALGWELLDNQKRHGVPNYYEYYYSFNFPKDFKSYINSTLTVLQNKQAELIFESKSLSTGSQGGA